MTAGFTSLAGLNNPTGLAVCGTTLDVATVTKTVRAYNLATGTAVPGFTPISSLICPIGVALYGNDLFVATDDSNTVDEYNATTGAVINANFITGLHGPYGLAIPGDRLLVSNFNGGTVGAYGIPASANARQRADLLRAGFPLRPGPIRSLSPSCPSRAPGRCLASV